MYLLMCDEWEQCILASARTTQSIFKPGTPACGWRRAPGFSKLFCADVYICVCQPPRLLLTSGMMWHEMDPIQLVKQVL